MKKLIKLYASWCGPCKVLDKMLKEHSNIKYENVDIDTPDGEGLSVKYNVRSVPTMLIVDEEGNLVNRLTGVPTVDELMKFVYEAD